VSHDASTASLAGQDAQYLTQAMNEYRTTRQHGAVQQYIAGLTDRDIADIVAFYAAQQPRAAEQPGNAARELADKCDRCHDAGDAAVVAPVLRGQDRDYLVMSLRAYRDGRRGNATMHHMSSIYGNVLIDSISTWYASQPPK
jgi:cytochrome c553